MRSLLFAISDTQIPAEHIDALAFSKHVVKIFKKKNDRVHMVHVGDEVDFHAMAAKWPADPNGLSAGNEIDEAIHRLRDWYRAFPQMDVCVSNHTWRPYKKAKAHGIPTQFMRDIKDVLEAPEGWHWAERWVHQNICFEHGEHVSGAMAALTAAHQNHMSTVIGHQHTFGGVTHSGSISGVLWGLNTGCLIDIDHYAFNYGKPLRKKPTLGMGVIIDGVPIFVPMYLGKNKRWVGRIL